MITLFHGDNVSQIQKEIETLLGGRKADIFDCKTDDFSRLDELLSTPDLFGQDRVVIARNVSTLSPSQTKILSEKLKGRGLDVILAEEKKITKKGILQIAQKVYLYQLPNYFFELLDSLTPGSGKRVTATLQNVLDSTSPELVFYSIIKRIRLLMQAKSGISDFEEGKRLQDWQMSRIQKQADRWTEDELLTFYSKLYQIEKDMKTSGSPLPLEKQLDIMVLSKLS